MSGLNRRGWLQAASLCAGGMAGWQIAGCSDAQTAGDRVRFSVSARGALTSGDAPTESFVNDVGWRVTLSEAKVVLGPVYFYTAEPQASLLDRLLGVKLAYGCPAHAQLDQGALVGEILKQYPVDLLASRATSLGEASGEAGPMLSTELHLHPPGRVEAGRSLSAMDGTTLRIAGEAEQDGRTVPFRGNLDIPNSGIMRIVQGIEGAGVSVGSQSNGGVLLEVLLDQWLVNVDFSNLEAGEIQEDDSVYAALVVFGMRRRKAYQVRWVEGDS